MWMYNKGRHVSHITFFDKTRNSNGDHIKLVCKYLYVWNPKFVNSLLVYIYRIIYISYIHIYIYIYILGQSLELGFSL